MTSSTPRVAGAIRTLSVLAILSAAGGAWGQQWQGPGGTGATPLSDTWTPNANWVGLAAPVPGRGTALTFSQTGGAAYSATNNFAGNFDLSSLTLNSQSNDSSDIRGGTLRFLGTLGPPPAPSGIIKTGARTFTVYNPLIVAGDPINVSANGGSLIFGRTGGATATDHIILNGAMTVDGQATGSVAFGTADVNNDIAISGGGSITVNGAYNSATATGTTVSFRGDNTFIGGVTLNAGVLRVGNSSTFSVPNILETGPLGTGALSVTGNSRLDGGDPAAVNGYATLGNNINIGSSTLVFGPNSVLALRGGKINIDASAGTPTFVTSLNSTLVLGLSSGFTQVGAAAAGFTKTGRGSINVYGDSPTLQGTVTIRNGTFHMEGTMAAPASSLAAFDLVQTAGEPKTVLSGTGHIYAATASAGFNTIVRPGRLAPPTPGPSPSPYDPGVLTLTGATTFSPGSDLTIQIKQGGALDHGILALEGTTTVSQTLMDVALDTSAPAGEMIVVNQLLSPGIAPPIAPGSFIDPATGLPLGQLSEFFASGAGGTQEFQINYFAGDGNDVSLTAVPAPASFGAVVLLAMVQRRRRS